MKIKLKMIAVLIFGIFFYSCKNTGLEPINNTARIIPGESIDGIHLGEYLETI